MTRTRSGLAAIALAAVSVGVTVANLPPPATGASPDASPGHAGTETATATVERRTLRVTEDLDGRLGYEGDDVVLNGLSGTYTRLPRAGDVLERGDTIAEVDGETVSTLLYGSRPAWRRMERGMTRGPDVRQLEQNLVALGFLSEDVEPDGTFGRRTERAVKRWQRSLGVERDGIVEIGEAVFQQAAVRITEVQPRLGARALPGEVLATTSSTDVVVTVDLPADRRGLVTEGDAVTVELPDGATVAATVSHIDSVARTPDDGSAPTITVTVTLDAARAGGDLDGADVTVTVERQRRDGVLAVPIDALLALREGGYAVEVVSADGSARLVAVTPGLFDDGYVEVDGGIREGDSVVVPS